MMFGIILLELHKLLKRLNYPYIPRIILPIFHDRPSIYVANALNKYLRSFLAGQRRATNTRRWCGASKSSASRSLTLSVVLNQILPTKTNIHCLPFRSMLWMTVLPCSSAASRNVVIHSFSPCKEQEMDLSSE